MSTVDYDESMKIDSDIGRLKMTKTNKNDKKKNTTPTWQRHQMRIHDW